MFCSILSINVESQDKASGERTRSVLHVIDLAGSERIAHSNVVSAAAAQCTAYARGGAHKAAPFEYRVVWFLHQAIVLYIDMCFYVRF